MCQIHMLKTELHCHNSFSNFHVGDDEPPYDCNVSIRDQLDRSYSLGLDVVFVTNHNTLDGYNQLLEYRNSHERFAGISVFPAEEATTDTGAHMLAYGLHEPIPAGLPIGEIIDEVRRQDGVSSAPHPFSLIDALREDAACCDMIETFNSNNVDVLSNVRATEFAIEHNMPGVAGSDSHVLSTFGRCVNMVDSENRLDDVLQAIKHGKVTISQTGYAQQSEALDHIQYKINNSREYIMEYLSEHYPHSKWLLRFLLRIYDRNPNSHLWGLLYKTSVYLMRRISQKVNFGDLDPGFMRDRDIVTMLKMSL